MGFDLGDWIDQTKQQVSDAVQQYAPIAESAVVTYASDALDKQKAQSQSKANAAIKAATSGPAPAPGSFGAALRGVFGQGVMSAKGGEILLIVGGILLVGLFIGRKG